MDSAAANQYELKQDRLLTRHCAHTRFEISNRFLLSAITKQERNTFTTFVIDCISNLGGWVDDVHMYSNIMTTIRFTIAESKIQPFSEVLATRNVTVRLERGSLNLPEHSDNSERSGSLQITFVHNDPDLKRDVQAVPGC